MKLIMMLKYWNKGQIAHCYFFLTYSDVFRFFTFLLFHSDDTEREQDASFTIT